jgi:hypothetical protein
MDNDDEKYLDPEQNPMIPREPGAEFKEPLKVGDPFFDPDGRSPMVDWDLTPEALAEKITAAFPGENEITIGSRILVRMVAGNYTEKESGKRIDELPLADLMMIGDFLRDREKR